MATRFYFHYGSGLSDYVPSITPSFDAEWNATGSVNRRLITPYKFATNAGSANKSETSATSPYDILHCQFISLPLLTQTISGDVKGILRCSGYGTDADMTRAIVIKVVSSDGLTVRGTLLSDFPAALAGLEFYNSNISFQTKWFPPLTTMTPVTCQTGDRIVVEIGSRAFNTLTATKYAYIHWDDTNATDCPENETSTSAGAGWLEFASDLSFAEEWQADEIRADVEYVQSDPYLITDHVQADVEYVDSKEFRVDEIQIDVEYTEPIAVVDHVQADVEYVDNEEFQVDRLEIDVEYVEPPAYADQIQADVEYVEIPDLRINRINFQMEVDTHESEQTNFEIDFELGYYIPLEEGNLTETYHFYNNLDFIDGIHFNEKYYSLVALRRYSADQICFNVSFVELYMDIDTISTQNSIVSVIQNFPKSDNVMESMRWYGVWKHSGKNLVEYSNKIWFALTDSTSGYVYSFDGTDLTLEYSDITLDDETGPTDIKVFDNKLFIAMCDHVIMYDGNTWTKTYPITLTPGEIAAGTYLETYSMCVHDGYLYLSITKKTPNGDSCTVNPYVYRYGVSWVAQSLLNSSTVGEGLLFMTSFNNMIYFIAKRGTMSFCTTVNYYDSLSVMNPGSFTITHLHTSGIGYSSQVYYYYCCLGLNNEGTKILVGGYNTIKEIDSLNAIETITTITDNLYFVNFISVTTLGVLRNKILWLLSGDKYCCEDIT